jgi:hypothetical protein
MTRKPVPGNGGTQAILRHWREAVPNDRLAHLVRDAAKGLTRALQARLAEEGVPFGHWVFLRILWETDGLTQSELSEEAGVMEPTTFAALKAMERLGYIKRRKTPENRKKVFIPVAVDVTRVAVNGAAPGEVAATRALLLRMIENLAADEGNRIAEDHPKSRKPSRRKRARA